MKYVHEGVGGCLCIHRLCLGTVDAVDLVSERVVLGEAFLLQRVDGGEVGQRLGPQRPAVSGT